MKEPRGSRPHGTKLHHYCLLFIEIQMLCHSGLDILIVFFERSWRGARRKRMRAASHKEDYMEPKQPWQIWSLRTLPGRFADYQRQAVGRVADCSALVKMIQRKRCRVAPRNTWQNSAPQKRREKKKNTFSMKSRPRLMNKWKCGRYRITGSFYKRQTVATFIDSGPLSYCTIWERKWRMFDPSSRLLILLHSLSHLSSFCFHLYK